MTHESNQPEKDESNVKGHMSDVGHIPVLLHEVKDGLLIKSSDIVVDMTVGDGGHARSFCDDLTTSGTLVGIDLDSEALSKAKRNLETCKAKVFLRKANFRNLSKILESLGIENVDKILLDLGLRSEQLDKSGRGFSFQKDEPLIMTFSDSEERGLTAGEIVNTWKEENLADIIYGFGGERYAKRIAKEIVSERGKQEIETTEDLVRIIKSAVPKRYLHGRIHPATRTFQALRITVNQELDALKGALEAGFDRLSSKGRIAVISYHSLEDRIVKHFFRVKGKEGSGKVVTKKPITPSETEVQENSFSRSAKLRIIEKL